MKYWIWIIPAIALLGCGSPVAEEPEKTVQVEPTLLPTVPSETTEILPEGDFDLAPELTNEVWLNTKEPLRLANLRGKVVLLEMWTFG
ncbi:MAG: hypothetical protein HN855_11370 [Anaerolineae bacterium]|jgi:hypothetical protein|nr:hypothetical protein [Anaerolineae bacterium]MBT7070516.1 hypothetical protein [Anaerolineae bacterium]MBT7325752.1 hypothetical protein [Anaerolineae bacterium]